MGYCESGPPVGELLPHGEAGMGNFNIDNRIDREARHCRTRAFGARLFARYPLHPSNAEAWEEVARAWDDLARLKEELAKTEGQCLKAKACLAAQQLKSSS
jgi:hypothetical protein